jgi:AcrR family transcriptional regulator
VIARPANARSRRTRAALLEAARELLEGQGFEALTMTAVADRAGVTRRAAYMHFASRSDVVAALFDHLAETEGLAASLAKVWRAPDAVTALDEWAAHIARYHPKLLAVDRALQQVWKHDADAAAHRARVIAEKLANCRRLADRLADEGCLSQAWTPATAADMLFALVASDVVEALLVDRRWSRRQLADGLGVLFSSTFVAADAHRAISHR